MLQDEIAIEIEEAEGDVTLVLVVTPVGTGRLLGELRLDERSLYVDAAHVEGLHPGAIGRAGINAILRKLLLEADVTKIVIQGATRTTGRSKGRIPRAIVFPH